MKTPSSFLALTLLCLASLPLPAQTFMRNVRVNDDPAGSRQSAPMVRVDRNGTVYVGWTDFSKNPNGDLYLSRSTDGGATFAPKVPIYLGGSVPSGMQRGLQLAIDSKGWLHAIWLEIKGTPDVSYSRSTDGGATFTAPRSISADSSRHNQDLPSIAIDAADNIYVASVDDREMRNGISKNTQIYFTKSTDGGVTFSRPIRASNMPGGVGGSCECCNTSIAVSPEEHVYISFRSNINNRRDIFIARSMNGGASFDTAIPAASERWVIPACPMSGSTIALDREETAHVMWRDSRPSSGSKNFIYYTTLRFGDTACATDTRISETKSTFPSIAITPDGGVLCAFQNTRVDEGDVVYRYSFDGGNSFTLEAKPSDETGSSRQELVITTVGSDGVRYAVWQDTRRDDGDIMLWRDTTHLQLVLPGAVRPDAPQNNAKLNSFQTFVWSPPANLVGAGNLVYDLGYETAGNRTTVRDIRNGFCGAMLEPGEYRWWVSARTMVGSSTVVDTLAFTLLGASSVDEITATALALSCHPNPAGMDGRATIGLIVPRGLNPAGLLTLIDPLGRVAMRLPVDLREAGEHLVPVDMSGLSAGLYHVVLHHGGRSVVAPLVVVQ